jgi:hypothetical protein
MHVPADIEWRERHVHRAFGPIGTIHQSKER